MERIEITEQTLNGKVDIITKSLTDLSRVFTVRLTTTNHQRIEFEADDGADANKIYDFLMDNASKLNI